MLPFIAVVGASSLLLPSAVALPASVALKSLTFALLQKRLHRGRAILMMIGGNILTSVVGVIAAVMIGSGAAWGIGIPIVWVLCWLPARRAVEVFPRLRTVAPGGLAFMLTGALVFSCILFGIGQGAILANLLVAYWLIKIAAVYIALLVSILLSAFWEEWVIWRLARVPEEETFMSPVLRANVFVLLVLMVIAAAIMLPKRLKSPDFLVKNFVQRLA